MDSDSLLAFAKTADEFNGLAKVKQGAELAMKSVPIEDHAIVVLHAAFLFNHAEYFSKLTDWIGKYREKFVFHLQEVRLEPKTGTEEIFGNVKMSLLIAETQG